MEGPERRCNGFNHPVIRHKDGNSHIKKTIELQGRNYFVTIHPSFVAITQLSFIVLAYF